ncbi:MarR family transcriptional regulator [Devosia sp. ZB163]|uniref:MarR family winged helix-turn-helix transcriptional regulator n=1 Tax=Devosia sp. ZB163 TaxID=3025938 RepID=UPI00236046B5|nr:MarR family transcriptional regulator [Devosia sp. ZB163]MDC9825714.1 MarR family transcriptional regulator [Devosia sp. ZB163]
MVKQLDDKLPPLIDHVGWRLWRLARQWKAEFDAGMAARGHGWMAEARGAVVGHLRPGGLSQSALTAAMGISKQAVQQLVDELVAEQIVERVPDPDDKRGKIVRLLPKGIKAIADGNEVKREIEARYAERIGAERLASLNAALDDLAG